MKYLIFVISIFMFSCSEDESCKQYSLITESNEKEADYKCDGLANNYPAFEIISKKSLGCLTTEELNIAKKTLSSVTKNYCNGVTFTVRTRIE
ncbi:MAG: hypothetical protein WAU01_04500 [Saprospiraceae bacterium]